jgi:SAM-dependent methyltransferase
MLNLITIVISLKTPYWYNPHIHNLGNTGILGNIHALSTPCFTKLIDIKAYKGINIRKQIYDTFDGDVLDMCCGTGFSTKPGNTGIDTSHEMLRFSNLFNPYSVYKFGNAETYGKDSEFDIVSCMFGFHEFPKEGHVKIVENCKRVARKKIVIVDISTDYKPSRLMLTGEPYIKDYLAEIDSTLHDFNKTIVIEGHVDMWTYEKL